MALSGITNPMTVRMLAAAWALFSPALAESPTAPTPPIENFRTVDADLCVGGEPVGDAAFKALADRGVRTVVTVDAQKPDLATAKKYGLRYVHIPIGYDGVPERAGAALARIAKEIDGPVYVHCHHGKHRGPAAAAVLGIASGSLDHAAATRLLEQAGTSRDYAGLWRDVAAYTTPPADAELPELVESASVESLAETMSGIDHIYDRLVAMDKAGWKPPAGQPDLSASHEATLLFEAFRESARGLPAERKSIEAGLQASERLAFELKAALDANESRTATAKLAAIKQSCTDCHKRHRDNGD